MHDNVAHEVQELAARCKQACQSYTRVSAELAALIDEHHSIVDQHEDLLVRASFELRVSHLPLCKPLRCTFVLAGRPHIGL